MSNPPLYQQSQSYGELFGFRAWFWKPLLEQLREEFRKMTSSFESALGALADVTDEIADALEADRALIAELRAAVASGDTARAEALAAQEAAHGARLDEAVSRLRGLGADPANPVPVTDPLPPVEPPADV